MSGSTMADGACVFCGMKGTVGEPCPGAGCRRNGYHFIPPDRARAHEALPERQRDPLVGRRLDEWLVVGRLGAGGFGSVYLAQQLPLGLRAAIKVLRLDHLEPVMAGRIVRRFEGEAKALAQLNHPNIVRLLKFGRWGDAPYIAMELVPGGRTLKAAVTEATSGGRLLEPKLVTHVLGQVLLGLEAAHGAEIIHRDIKPENIMLQSVVGDPHHVRLVDFGLAKVWDESGATSLIIGTPIYMAPEQLRGTRIGPWTDLYAVGVIAFELLTGLRPFPGGEQDIRRSKLDVTYDPVIHARQLPQRGPLAAFLRRALAGDLRTRFGDARSMRQALFDSVDAADTTRIVARPRQVAERSDAQRLEQEQRRLEEERRALEREREALAAEKSRLVEERRRVTSESTQPQQARGIQDGAGDGPPPSRRRRAWLWAGGASLVVSAALVGLGGPWARSGESGSNAPPPVEGPASSGDDAAGESPLAPGGGAPVEPEGAVKAEATGATAGAKDDGAEGAQGAAPPGAEPATRDDQVAGTEQPAPSPEGPADWMAGAATAIETQDWTGAIALLEKVRATEPANREAESTLASARAELDRKDRIAEVERQVEARNYQAAWAKIGTLHASATGSVYSGRIRELYESVRGSYVDAQVTLADDLRRAGKLEEAESAIEAARAADPTSDRAKGSARKVSRAIDEARSAAQAAAKAAAEKKRREDDEKKQREEAEAAAERTRRVEAEVAAYDLRWKGSEGRRLYHEGRAFKIQGNLPSAIERFKAAAKAGYPDAHKQLGVIYASQGKGNQAVHHYGKYLGMKPWAADAKAVRTAIERLGGRL